MGGPLRSAPGSRRACRDRPPRAESHRPLPDDQRLVVTLVDLQGLNYDEASRVAGNQCSHDYVL